MNPFDLLPRTSVHLIVSIPWDAFVFYLLATFSVIPASLLVRHLFRRAISRPVGLPVVALMTGVVLGVTAVAVSVPRVAETTLHLDILSAAYLVLLALPAGWLMARMGARRSLLLVVIVMVFVERYPWFVRSLKVWEEMGLCLGKCEEQFDPTWFRSLPFDPLPLVALCVIGLLALWTTYFQGRAGR